MTTPQPPAKSEDDVRKQLEKLYNESRQMGMLRTGSPMEHMVDGTMKLIAQEAEAHADRVIGSDKTLPRYITEWSEEDGEEYWYNKLRAEQRSRNHYPLEGGE